jgi:hypothetical protein
MENLKTELLSCQIPNDPDKWKRPALSDPKKTLTDDDIRNFIIRIEDTLELPLGILSMPGKGTINGHKIPALKQAAIFHIVQVSKVSYRQLAPYFGLAAKQSIEANMKAAQNFKDINDETFTDYYQLIQSIAI